MIFLGNPEYGCELQPIDFVMFAEACGGTGFRIEKPQECGAVLEAALGLPGPVIVEAVVDPYEPPMPPKITAEQARNFAEALIKGEPAREKILRTVIKDRIKEMI